MYNNIYNKKNITNLILGIDGPTNMFNNEYSNAEFIGELNSQNGYLSPVIGNGTRNDVSSNISTTLSGFKVIKDLEYSTNRYCFIDGGHLKILNETFNIENDIVFNWQEGGLANLFEFNFNVGDLTNTVIHTNSVSNVLDYVEYENTNFVVTANVMVPGAYVGKSLVIVANKTFKIIGNTKNRIYIEGLFEQDINTGDVILILDTTRITVLSNNLGAVYNDNTTPLYDTCKNYIRTLFKERLIWFDRIKSRIYFSEKNYIGIKDYSYRYIETDEMIYQFKVVGKAGEETLFAIGKNKTFIIDINGNVATIVGKIFANSMIEDIVWFKDNYITLLNDGLYTLSGERLQKNIYLENNGKPGYLNVQLGKIVINGKFYRNRSEILEYQDSNLNRIVLTDLNNSIISDNTSLNVDGITNKNIDGYYYDGKYIIYNINNNIYISDTTNHLSNKIYLTTSAVKINGTLERIAITIKDYHSNNYGDIYSHVNISYYDYLTNSFVSLKRIGNKEFDNQNTALFGLDTLKSIKGGYTYFKIDSVYNITNVQFLYNY